MDDLRALIDFRADTPEPGPDRLDRIAQRWTSASPLQLYERLVFHQCPSGTRRVAKDWMQIKRQSGAPSLVAHQLAGLSIRLSWWR